MTTLYVTDLDGTFLTDEARVSDESARIVSSLSRAGALISVATARTPATVEPLLADTYTTARMVVMTGAALWDRSTRSYVGMRLLPAGEVDVILDCMRRRGVNLFGYSVDDGGHLDVYHEAPALTAPERRFVDLRRNLGLKTFHLAQSLPLGSRGHTALFFGMGTREAIVGLAGELSAITSCYVSYYKDTYLPDLWLIEIFAGGVSKAAGIARLRESVKADRVVAFGDNLNDIPMLREADVAVAVANALPETKAVADVVIGSNNDDSVARFIAGDFERNS